MKKIILLLCALVLIVSCTKQKYYEIPRDANGNVILTGISSTTTTGISTLDGSFSVTATFATAKAGDVMDVELLQLQIPPTGGSYKTVTANGRNTETSYCWKRYESDCYLYQG